MNKKIKINVKYLNEKRKDLLKQHLPSGRNVYIDPNQDLKFKWNIN